MKPSEIKKGMVVAAVISGTTFKATVVDPKPGAVVGYSSDGTKQEVTYQDKVANAHGILKPNRNVLVEIETSYVETSYVGSSALPRSSIKKQLFAVSPYKLGEPSDALKAQWERAKTIAAEYEKALVRKKKQEEKVKSLIERLGLPPHLVRGWNYGNVSIPLADLEKLVRRYEARGRKAKAKVTA